MCPDAGVSILVAEDDSATLDILCSIIRIRYPGIRVLPAEDGDRALEILREEAPVIFLTDYDMPGMTGMEVARQITSIRGDMKIVVITAYDQSRIDEVALEDGIKVDHFLNKPVAFETLFEALDDCLRGVSGNG